MTITDPAALHPAWVAAFDAKDIPAMTALGEDGYVFAPNPGLALTGEAAEGALGQFLAIGLPIELTVRHIFVKDDIALVVADWALKGFAADGSEVDMGGSTADVLRNGPDGWKFVIDNPFGTA